MMVLDEPTAALDPKHQEYFVDAIQQLTEHLSENQNFQFIIITHNEDIWDAASATVYKFESSTNGTIVNPL
jgi:energy-coupling factor transporter ATP-binding protein EcfA2